MIAHQAINVDDRSIPLSCGFKIGKKLSPVANAFENRFLFIPSRGNMIESAGKLYPQCSGHNQIKDFIGGMSAHIRLLTMGLRLEDEIEVVTNNGRGQLVVAANYKRFVIGRGLAEKIIVQPPKS